MKKPFTYINIQRLFVAIILIWTSAISNVTKVQAEDMASALIFELRKNGLNVPDQLNYSQIVQKLQSMQIDVPVSYKESVMKYLHAGRASHLIKIQTSKPGILTWHFHSVMFFRKDLASAKCDDGEMYGGDILLKIAFSDNQAIDMRALWNYH